jgi:glutamate dehydrogenase (NAD(P)+)
MSNVHRIAAQVICPGANNPITPEAENALIERGVLCLPDFVTNCGGVLGGTMEFASVSREKITTFINHHIGVRIAWLLNEAKSKHQLPREVAEPFALGRFNQAVQRTERPTLLSRFFDLGLEFYRQGWIPGCLVAPLSLRYFKKLLT